MLAVDHEVFYAPAMLAVLVIAVRLVWPRICAWANAFPHYDDTERALLEHERVNEALRRTEQVQKERTR